MMTAAPHDASPRSLRIPDDIWISLRAVVEYIGCDRPLLERQAEQLGIPLDETGSIRCDHLPRLVGPVAARSILRAVNTFGPEGAGVEGAASILKVGVRHVMGLVQRRGVWVGHSGDEPVISRSGLVTLARILERERAFPILEDDFLPAQEAPPHHRARRAASIWAASSGPTVAESDELDGYRDMGIRWRGGACRRSIPGAVQWVGFDLYRLLGIALPGMRLEAYRHMMDRAFAEETKRGPLAAIHGTPDTRGRVA